MPTVASEVPGLVTGDTWWSLSEKMVREHPELSAGFVEVGRSVIPSALLSRPPTLVLTDADSTLFAEEVIDELADIAGVGSEVATITEAAMRGQLDFDASLARRVALLEGLPETALTQVRQRLTFRDGFAELLDWTHAQKATFGVVSGGFEQVIGPLLTPLGVDRVLANVLEIEQGRLTGRTLGPIINGAAKKEALVSWSRNTPERSITVGDGANDIPMLQASGVGVAFCAKEVVRSETQSYLAIPRLDAVIGLVGPRP